MYYMLVRSSDYECLVAGVEAVSDYPIIERGNGLIAAHAFRLLQIYTYDGTQLAPTSIDTAYSIVTIPNTFIFIVGKVTCNQRRPFDAFNSIGPLINPWWEDYKEQCRFVYSHLCSKLGRYEGSAASYIPSYIYYKPCSNTETHDN